MPKATQFKTSHQLARELLALPDLPLCIEEWYRTGKCQPTATLYGPDGEKSVFIFKLPNRCEEDFRKSSSGGVYGTPQAMAGGQIPHEGAAAMAGNGQEYVSRARAGEEPERL